jgi:hypothetical protein
MNRNRIFSPTKCRKLTFRNTQVSSTYIKLSSLDMLILDIKFGTLALLLEQSDFTLRKLWYIQLFLIPTQVYPKSLN